ncbi:U32 family peptidase [Marispirochaeta aestuarii]|uniref:peptidase U32 family protein n=1 Tax=Marispirochaeta aestuarii TaxID=1963862 RepID=UPI0029C7715A|nr:U32 family peptidase [Marispirochaeta aestuarii]
MKKNTIELLAPGGDAGSVKAAILAGADAVYLGVGDFNARKRAVNIRPEGLPELCSLAHRYGCRIYLTLNILAFEEEFSALSDLLVRTMRFGIDAVIIQDYGLLQHVRRAFPDLEIHASTQMTTHNSGQLKLLAESGVKQVNFARELSLSELTELTAAAHKEGLKAEVFVHGAYCVSFSGQCYMSGLLYENSANRGACVQPCRREYIPDSGNRGGGSKVLNLKDNSVFSRAADLYAAGVDSLKIEGRIKGYEYVYSTVLSWREQLDRIYEGENPAEKDSRLSTVFNRSFSDNLLQGRLGADSFTPESGDRSLVPVGTVDAYNARAGELVVSRDAQLSAGQSITVTENSGSFICTGILGESTGNRGFRFRIEHKLMGKIKKGQLILAQDRLIDFSAVKDKISSMSADPEKLPLEFSLQGEADKALELSASFQDKRITLVSDALLEKASEHPSSPDLINKQLSRLGNTCFYLASCDLEGLEEGLFIPVTVLNDLRRKAVGAFEADLKGESEKGKPVTLVPGDLPKSPRIALAVADREQLKQIPDDGSVLPVFQLPADVEVLAEVEPLFADYPDLIPWFPSILIRQQYTAASDFLLRTGAGQIITDNSGIACLARERGIPWIAGPLLNATNGYALDFLRQHGAAGAFCSSELEDSRFDGITVPAGIELWAPFAGPDFLMKSRHCIVRNCRDCGKRVMDARCLPDCSRSAEITDTQGNEILVIKSRGDYNSLYRKGLRVHPDRLKDPRVGTWLLDLRVRHRSMQPDCSIPEFIEYAQGQIRGGESSKVSPGSMPGSPVKGGCL